MRKYVLLPFKQYLEEARVAGNSQGDGQLDKRPPLNSNTVERGETPRTQAAISPESHTQSNKRPTSGADKKEESVTAPKVHSTSPSGQGQAQKFTGESTQLKRPRSPTQEEETGSTLKKYQRKAEKKKSDGPPVNKAKYWIRP